MFPPLKNPISGGTCGSIHCLHDLCPCTSLISPRSHLTLLQPHWPPRCYQQIPSVRHSDFCTCSSPCRQCSNLPHFFQAAAHPLIVAQPPPTPHSPSPSFLPGLIHLSIISITTCHSLSYVLIFYLLPLEYMIVKDFILFLLDPHCLEQCLAHNSYLINTC